MLQKRLIPTLLLRNQGLVKTRRFKNPTYVGDPVNIVKIFNDKEVDELLLLDIVATPERRPPNLSLLRDIASECFVPLGYGGGVRDLATARALFTLGFEKLIINTQAIESPEFIRAAAAEFGSQSIVVSIDVRKTWLRGYEAMICGGRRGTRRDPIELARAMEDAGAGELLVNSIDRDGTMGGYDLDLIRQVTSAVSVPVVAAGGAGDLSHCVDAVHCGGASAAAAGSLFVFQGRHRAVLVTFPTPAERRQAFQD